jgi:hypothetical protein
MDVCGEAETAPLSDLSLRVVRPLPRKPIADPGASCLFELRTADGRGGTLFVEAATPPSTDAAERYFMAVRKRAVLNFDGNISESGEQAGEFSREHRGMIEYVVHARLRNLVAEVFLAVPTGAASRQRLATTAREILRAAMAAVPEI